MQILIEATPDFVTVDGVPCRRWHGRTDGGTPCDVFVRVIRLIETDGSREEFECLQRVSAPRLSTDPLPGVPTPPTAAGLM